MEKVAPKPAEKKQFLGAEAQKSAKTLAPPQFKLDEGKQSAAGPVKQLKPADGEIGMCMVEPSSLPRLNEILNNLDVPEEEVISLCSKLTVTEKLTVLSTPSYRIRMASALNFAEMKRALNLLGGTLATKLDWLEAAASTTSGIDYNEIRSLVTAASQDERNALKSTRWRIFFVDVCDDATIIDALLDLKFDLQTTVSWLSAEGLSFPTAQDGVLGNLDNADDATKAAHRKDSKLIDSLYKVLPAAEFAAFASSLVLIAPSTCVDRPAAIAAAKAMITVQLANKEVAKTAVSGTFTAVIIPRDKLLTDISQFSALAGTKTFDGREWEPTRGVGYGQYVALAEENLLGGECTAVFNGNKVNGTYDEGYSTASHEFAHGLHDNVLSAADRKIIEDAYKARKVLATAAPTDKEQWVDGREGCYASMTDHEFFAQLSNAYLGTNTGSDPFLSEPRHNGKDWVRTNEPKVFALLEKMYAGGSVRNANPKPATT